MVMSWDFNVHLHVKTKSGHINYNIMKKGQQDWKFYNKRDFLIFKIRKDFIELSMVCIECKWKSGTPSIVYQIWYVD